MRGAPLACVSAPTTRSTRPATTCRRRWPRRPAGLRPQIVIDAAGEPASVNLALELVRPYGQLLLFGVPRQPVFEFAYLTWYRKRPHMQTSSIADGTGSALYELALNLIARGDVDVAGLISHRLPLARVADAYDLARTRRDGALKVAVDFREGGEGSA